MIEEEPDSNRVIMNPNGRVNPLERIKVQEKDPKVFILIEKRDLLRSLFVNWVININASVEIHSAADAADQELLDAFPRATMVVLGSAALGDAGLWLSRQVSMVRMIRSDLPLVVIVEPFDISAIRASLKLPSIQGYISTSSSLAIATAALNLVAVGGNYSPCEIEDAAQDTKPLLGVEGDGCAPDPCEKLTPRELGVLALLRQGMANKIIAYRLGLSQSTVKAHVHNIMTKLHVSNRTEAALTYSRDAAPPCYVDRVT